LIRVIQNYWNNKKNTKTANKTEIWEYDFNLISWTNLTLFDEYLEMGNNIVT
jgi:hypothetical protein